MLLGRGEYPPDGFRAHGAWSVPEVGCSLITLFGEGTWGCEYFGVPFLGTIRRNPTVPVMSFECLCLWRYVGVGRQKFQFLILQI